MKQAGPQPTGAPHRVRAGVLFERIAWAMEHGPAQERRTLAERLIRAAAIPWRRKRALGVLACNWDRLDTEVRARVLANWSARLADAGFEGAFGESERERIGAAAVLSEPELGGSSAVLLGLLRDPAAAVRVAAAQGATGLMRARLAQARMAGSGGVGGVGGRATDGEALTIAARLMETFDLHRSESALTAVLEVLCVPGVMADAPPELAGVLDEPGHPAMLTARGGLRRSAREAGSVLGGLASRVRLWRFESLRPALGLDAGWAERAAKSVSLRHLVLHPARHEQHRRAEAERDGVTEADAESAVTIAGMLGSSNAVERLRGIAEARSARWEQGRGLGGVGGSAAASRIGAALTDVCFDAHGGLARSALLTIRAMGVGELNERMAGHLARSPHAGVRGLVSMVVPRRADVESVVVARERLRWHRRLKRDRQGAMRELRGALTGSGEGWAPGVLSALELTRRLALASELEAEICAIADGQRDGTPGVVETVDAGVERARAVAVALLGGLGVRSLASCAALLRCARSEDARVRANAMEALAGRALRGDDAARAAFAAGIAAWVGDRAHRPASTAAVWACRLESDGLLTEAGNGGGSAGMGCAWWERSMAVIASMLEAPDAMARRAGVWAAERSAALIGSRAAATGQSLDRRAQGRGSAEAMLAGLRERVNRLAMQDPDDGVRLAAERGRMIIAAGLRAGWSGRTADLGAA